MSTLTRPRCAALWQLAAALARATADALRRLAGELAQRRALARAEREFARLDDRTLADLGLHRSECASLLAEWRGTAPPTRRRIAGQDRPC